jgi:hypothetical protein
MTTQQRNYYTQVQELLFICEEAEQYLPDDICESIEICRVALLDPPFDDTEEIERDEYGFPILRKIETKARQFNEELWK